MSTLGCPGYRRHQELSQLHARPRSAHQPDAARRSSLGPMALGVTMLAQVLPSLGASRHTIISYKQELARTVRAPWWQRAWLDLLLLIPVGYGIYLLQPARQRAAAGRQQRRRHLRQPAALPAACAGRPRAYPARAAHPADLHGGRLAGLPRAPAASASCWRRATWPATPASTRRRWSC